MGSTTSSQSKKKLPDPASIACVRFDDQAIERFRAMQPLASVQPLTPDDFEPRGFTPLLDAVGTTLVSLDEDWKRETPDRVIVVIATDGRENASKEYTKAKVQSLIKAREASQKWSIIYLGANVDAFAEASALGIRQVNTAGYTASSAGIGSTYSTVSDSVKQMRSSGATAAHNLGGNIAEDGTLQRMAGSTVTAQNVWTPPQQDGTEVWVAPAA